MRISDVIGLLAAVIGTTATLFSAWGTFRSKHSGKKEISRAVLIVTIIIALIFGFAVLVSRATTIKINGTDTIPVGPVVPGGTTPAPGLTPSPTVTPSPSATPSSSPIVTPSPSATPSPETPPTPLPSPAATSTKTGS